MSKEFAERLEKPAKASGERAGKAMSEGMESAVENLERQVKASSSKLQDLDRAYEKSASKQAAQKEKLEAATLKLQDAEDKYQAALEKGDKGIAELAKVKEAKARVIGETEKLEQAEIDVRVAEQKHKDQLDDLNSTLAKLQDSQSDLNRELEKSSGAFGGMGTGFSSLKGNLSAVGPVMDSISSRLKGMVGLLGGAGLAGALKSTVTAGMDYELSMNTLQAVSGASADTMELAAKRARELGNDVSLPATSAASATDAMVELAKGGMDVAESMDAARGTIALAAAAQIDAGQAATIQAAALNTFSLEADQATRVADVLANTANASSAELTDVAEGLAQAGTVANQFGVTLEDTSATLGMFANAGIKGSDAGTLMKTALLKLANQSDPAKGAIEELGLSIYDANGKFVGMRSLMEQLQEASGRMTDEQYQAATATLFGSDAMRLAGIAAEQGVEGFDKMRDSVSRSGAALDVAGAKMEGLPGAMEKLQNNVEELGLALYEEIKGPLETVVKSASKAVDGLSAFWGLLLKIPGASQALTAVLVATAAAVAGLSAAMLGSVGVAALLNTAKGVMTGLSAANAAAFVAETAALEGVTLATAQATFAMKAFATAILTSPITWIAVAVAAAGAALWAFFTKTEVGRDLWDKFVDALKAGWDWISGVFATGWDWLADKIGGFFGWFSDAWNGLWDLFVNRDYTAVLKDVFGWDEDSAAVDYIFRVRDAFTGLMDKVSYVKSTVVSAWGEMVSAFKGGDDGYVGIARIVGADKAEWIVGKLHEVGDALSKLPDLASGVWDILFKGDYTGLPFGLEEDSGVVDFLFNVREAVQGLWDFLQEKRDQLAALLQPVVQFMAGAMRDVISSLGDIFKSLWDSLKSVGESLGSALGSVAVSLFESLVSVIQSLWKAFQSLWEAVKPIGEFFIKLLLPILKVVGAVVGGVVVGAVFLLVEALKIVAEVLAWVADKFAWLMENVLGPLIEILGRVAAFIIDTVVSAFTWLAEKVMAVFTTVLEWIGTFLTFLQENFWPVVESILGFVGDAFSALWDGISWAWENVIQPVFNGILELAKITIGVIATIILTPLLIAWNLLSTAIQWAWENIIQPVWQALSDFAMNTLWPVLQSVIQWIGDAWQWLSDKFTEAWGWIRDNVLNPMVDFFQNTLWPAIQSVIDWIVDKWNWLSETLSTVWGWIYDNVIQRVIDGFHAIWDAVSAVAGWIADKWNWLYGVLLNIWNWLNENVIQRQIRGFHRIWEAVLSVAGWIADKWQWMADRLHAGWVWIDEHVFGPLKSGLDTVKGWFRSTVDNIGRIWDGIREKTKKPVEFVVNTVYNNGIRSAWNAVAGLVGLDKLKEIKFATGGVLPGYTPGRDPYTFIDPRTGMRIGLSGGEAIMRPEWTRAMGGPKAIERMNRAATRGEFTSPDFWGGKVPTTYGDPRLDSMSDIPNPEAHHPVSRSNLQKAMQAHREALLRQQFASGGIYTPTPQENSQLGGGSVNRSLWIAAKTAFPNANLNSAKTDHQNDGGYHPRGQAIDLGGPMQQIANWIFSKWPKTAQLIYGPGPLALWGRTGHIDPKDQAGIRAAYGPGTMAGHYDHVHWASDGIVTSDGLMVSDDGASDGGFNIMSAIKGLWDRAVEKIGKFPGAEKFGQFGKLPAAMAKKLLDAAWKFVSDKAGKFDGAAGTSGNVESWREMAMAAMRRNGFNADDPAQVNAMMAQIQSESGGNPGIMQNGYVDVNTGGNEAVGLLQIVPGTFESHRDPTLPNDRTDPWANMNAALRYYRSKYGDDLTTMWGHGHGYASGGVVELPKLYDQGGWLPHGGFAQNLSGKPEPVFTASQWSSLSDMIRTLGDLVPAIKGQTDVIAKAVDDAQAWLAKAGDYNSIEGINARQGVRRVLDLGLDLPGSDIVKMVLDGEDTLWESRARAAKNLDTIVEKEKALEEARKAVADLNDMPEGVSEDDQKKIDEAQKALDDAKAEKAKAESDDDRAKAADKVTEAEKKLKDVREEVDKNSEENAKKHAEEVTKANEAVSKAEQELADARKKQAMDLDNVVLLSQGQIKGMIPQAKQLADQLIGMGAPAQAVNAGLGQVTGQLMQLAGFAGPAGITLGMAMDMLKVGIGIIKAIVGAITDLIAKIRKARLDALKALADGWSVIADYAKLIVDLQGKVTTLQQALIRGANAQREAEYNLMLAQHDRYIAEAEGALKVAEARLALDAEIKRGATIAQLKMMGLHEDWDSYMAYQALEAQGVLEEWSDSAISALFTYEKARAEALKGEVSARLEQIKAEAALAEAQRENVRNQQDLLKAQERLIRMSAKVAGVDLVDATGTAQVAKLMAEMAEVKQAMDKNTLGRWGAKLGANGSHANEYRGQQAQYNSLQQALDAVLAETGVNIDRGNLDRVLKLMGRAAYRGGDPMAVLRAQLPELAQAETALKINESLKPVYDARDQRDDLARKVEDFTAEIDLYEKTTPLEHTLKGLDYTIKSLEQASQAWADGNEELRGEYLAAAKANRDAAEAAGVDWKLDSKYANAGVRDQIRRETTIHLDGEKMYTADQIDQLLAEVTSGTNGSYRIVRSASEVAVSRRKELV
ncbi:phage tail tape measure protein [Corynebacterium marquesiae]|uniref:phage tail tape measure protein n=1 Tax=Corynebacterium marquesiae TaxID=2913503 RepID=UPI0038CFD7BE